MCLDDAIAEIEQQHAGTTEQQPAQYEYGIRWRRNGEIHRTGMTRKQAEAFMDPAEWDGATPERAFEVIRRPIGQWQRVDEEV